MCTQTMRHVAGAAGLFLAALLGGCAVPGTRPADAGQTGATGAAATTAAGATTPGATAAGATATDAATTPGTPGDRIPPFSKAGPGEELPAGWEPWILRPHKTRTIYKVVEDSGKRVLRAQASSSASGLATRLDVDPQAMPVLQWRWRAESLADGADVTVATAEDSPVRIVLAFDGDKSELSFRDQLFFEQAKTFSGHDLPYATLMYIWENTKPVGTVLPNPHTPRIQKLVVETGAKGLRRWHTVRRNIVEDYKRAFGKPPGRLIGVAVMSDTDNTRTEVVAYYGDIELLPR